MIEKPVGAQLEQDLKTRLAQQPKDRSKDFGTAARMAGNIADGLMSSDNSPFIKAGTIDREGATDEAIAMTLMILEKLRKALGPS